MRTCDLRGNNKIRTLLKKRAVHVPDTLPRGVEARGLDAVRAVLVNQVQDRTHYDNGCGQTGPRLKGSGNVRGMPARNIPNRTTTIFIVRVIMRYYAAECRNINERF